MSTITPDEEAALRRQWAEHRRAAGLTAHAGPELAARVVRILRGAQLRPGRAGVPSPNGTPTTSDSPSPTPGTTPAEPSKGKARESR